eukprot:GHVQ01029871.1.p1 GENE.GHVQ01029871.1~~GHVQ01029871.1.p1  ORF type:complete len:139 (-),score=26.65 GHVQ01029871.1:666-1082(-)
MLDTNNNDRQRGRAEASTSDCFKELTHSCSLNPSQPATSSTATAVAVAPPCVSSAVLFAPANCTSYTALGQEEQRPVSMHTTMLCGAVSGSCSVPTDRSVSCDGVSQSPPQLNNSVPGLPTQLTSTTTDGSTATQYED